MVCLLFTQWATIYIKVVIIGSFLKQYTVCYHLGLLVHICVILKVWGKFCPRPYVDSLAHPNNSMNVNNDKYRCGKAGFRARRELLVHVVQLLRKVLLNTSNFPDNRRILVIAFSELCSSPCPHPTPVFL